VTEKIDPTLFIDRPRYLTKSEMATRYATSLTTITSWLNHVDATQRLPPARLTVGSKAFWAVDDLDRFDAEQAELSKHREVRRGPPQPTHRKRRRA
jgi:hypothetical protein